MNKNFTAKHAKFCMRKLKKKVKFAKLFQHKALRTLLFIKLGTKKLSVLCGKTIPKLHVKIAT